MTKGWNDVQGETTTGLVEYRREGNVAYVTLARPTKLNAFNDQMVLDLREALTRFDRDPDAFVAVLHGDGRCFSTGADVRERQLRSPEEMKAFGGPESPNARWGDLMYDSVNWKPIVAAVHGYALGLALGLALQCDLVVASASAQFQITETPRGLHGSRYWALLRYRGAGALADEVAMTGRYFSGEEAADARVINKAVPDGAHLDAATELAVAVAGNPPLAVRANVRARRWDLKQYEQQFAMFREAQPALHLTEDFRESASAFAEKRRPNPYKAC